MTKYKCGRCGDRVERPWVIEELYMCDECRQGTLKVFGRTNIERMERRKSCQGAVNRAHDDDTVVVHGESEAEPEPEPEPEGHEHDGEYSFRGHVHDIRYSPAEHVHDTPVHMHPEYEEGHMSNETRLMFEMLAQGDETLARQIRDRLGE